jgi:hypothetical protein
MSTTIEVQASDREFALYKTLVDSDWNKRSQEGVLGVLWAVIAKSAASSKWEWSSVFRFPAEKDTVNALNQEIIEKIRSLSEMLTEASIPTISSVFSSKKTKAITLAEKTWAYLMLPSLVQLKGEAGFFLDLQSLLYLSTVHYLLPLLDKQDTRAEHDCLLNAMYVHTILAWRGQPSHMFYLQSALMGRLGQDRRRLELLDLSLGLTPISDHSYLTKANAYWIELLELGDREAAMKFLLNLNRIAPISYQDEIREMIEETAAS